MSLIFACETIPQPRAAVLVRSFLFISHLLLCHNLCKSKPGCTWQKTTYSRTFSHSEVVKDFFLQSCEKNSIQRKWTTELCPEEVRYRVSLIRLCGFFWVVESTFSWAVPLHEIIFTSSKLVKTELKWRITAINEEKERKIIILIFWGPGK